MFLSQLGETKRTQRDHRVSGREEFSGAMMRRLALLTAAMLPTAFGVEPLTQSLSPPGGGSFKVTLSACKDQAAVLNGQLTNHTGDTWLYIEIQVKVTHGSSMATYRFNLERIGEKGATIRQPLEGVSKVDCESIRISGLELIAAHSDARADRKKQ